MLPISAIIITKNEEANIGRCIQSLTGWVNEIVVADNGSTDQTIEIATSLGANVARVEWLGYGATKNLANGLSKNDWILSLDADEEVSKELKQAIENAFAKNLAPECAFYLQRKMVYCDRVLQYGASRNEWRLRLFHKSNARWDDAMVHETILFEGHVNKSKLKGVLWHHSYQNEEEHIERLHQYAALHAKQMQVQNKKVSRIKGLISPAFSFIKNYMFKLGFLDGRLGFRYAIHEMNYVKEKYALMNQKRG